MSTKLRSVGDAFALTVIGIVAAFVAASGIGAIVAEFHAQGTTLARTIQYAQVQVGFLVVALGYLLYVDVPSGYARFRLPSARDIGWLIPLGLVIFVFSAPNGSWFLTSALATTPSMWLVVIVWWFVIATPAEELLFRGIIQGRLRSSFSAIPSIILAAGLFAGMHAVFALSQGEAGNLLSLMLVMFVTGLIFGTVYERTGNLVVPAFAHAMFWLSPALFTYA